MLRHTLLALWLLLVATPVAADLRFPLDFRWEGMRCRVPNGEITPDQRTVLVHAFLSCPQAVKAVPWQNLFTLVNCRGEELRPSGDCGVDSGTGLAITTGSFPLAGGREVRLLIYFSIHPDELPVRLLLPDGSRTVIVER